MQPDFEALALISQYVFAQNGFVFIFMFFTPPGLR